MEEEPAALRPKGLTGQRRISPVKWGQSGGLAPDGQGALRAPESRITEQGAPEEVISESRMKETYGIKVKVVHVGDGVDRKVCLPSLRDRLGVRVKTKSISHTEAQRSQGFQDKKWFYAFHCELSVSSERSERV